MKAEAKLETVVVEKGAVDELAASTSLIYRIGKCLRPSYEKHIQKCYMFADGHCCCFWCELANLIGCVLPAKVRHYMSITVTSYHFASSSEAPGRLRRTFGVFDQFLVKFHLEK